MSIVYSIQCAECGKDLDCSCSLDSGGDLNVKVETCSDCLENSKAEGYEEAKKEYENQ